MSPLDWMRLERGAAHLHALGPRATAMLLATLAERTSGAPAMLGLLAQYERLTPHMVRAIGADRFPRRPLHLVERGA